MSDLERSIEEKEEELAKLEAEEDQEDDDSEQEDSTNNNEKDDGTDEEESADDEEAVEDEDDDSEDSQGDDEDALKQDLEKIEQKSEGDPSRAHERIQNRQQQQRIDDLERQIAELKKPKETKITTENAKNFEEWKSAKGVDDKEPNKQEDYEAWLEWRDRELERRQDYQDERFSRMERASSDRAQADEQQQTVNQALNELKGYVQNCMNERADAKEVFDHLEQSLADSVRMLNPHYNAQQVQQAVTYKLLELGSNLYNSGHDPGVGLYEMGKQSYEPPKKKTDNLKNIKKNKERSGTPLNKGGKSSTNKITYEDYDNMSLADKMNLTNEEIDEIENELL